jgi:hypothetical protein
VLIEAVVTPFVVQRSVSDVTPDLSQKQVSRSRSDIQASSSRLASEQNELALPLKRPANQEILIPGSCLSCIKAYERRKLTECRGGGGVTHEYVWARVSLSVIDQIVCKARERE